MSYIYDEENIFAKIIRGEIPNTTVLENEFALAFRDIAPQAPIHILLIPKGSYVNLDDFLNNASEEEITGFNQLFLDVIVQEKLSSENGEGGYRAISNSGAYGMQEVPHYHLHILSGRALGPLLVE